MTRKIRKDANIDRHGTGWRIRYTHAGKRYAVTVKGDKSAARAKWNEIKAKLDKGQHIAPSAMTFAEWVPEFLKLVENKRQNARTAEYYAHKLKYAIDAFGDKSLQKITATDIDDLTADLKGKVLKATKRPMSEGSRRHVFVATKACLSAAVRKGHIDRNPASSAEGVDVDQTDVGDTLPREKFASFLAGFKSHPLESVVIVALHTGARLNEILAIRHSDIDDKKGVLRIAQAVERTKAYGIRFKIPKSGKGRELTIDANLLALFRRERDALARLIAGVPQGADVDLSLVKVPADALVFWAVPRGGLLHFGKPRNDSDISRNFRTQATALGFPKLRFHDLRGSHETALLDAGVPVHVVAARCGHSAAMLLKTYAERTQSADAKAADAMAAIFRV